MPTPLNAIDLSTVTVSATGKIDLSNCAPTSNPAFINKNATLVLYNESGAGLRLAGLITGLAADLPAGGWLPLPVPTGETTIIYTVQYIIAGALVSTLLATYFAPGESITSASLGNSPIGGSLTNQTAPITLQVDTTASAVIEMDFLDKRTNSHEFQFKKDTSSMSGPGTGMYYLDVNTNKIPFGFAPTGLTVDNGGCVTDGSGNWSAPSYLTIGGKQETGKAGGIAQATAGGQTFAFPVNFKTVMTNVPSSITLTASNSANNTGASATNIDKFGFFLVVTSSAAGGVDWRGTYTTVGN